MPVSVDDQPDFFLFLHCACESRQSCRTVWASFKITPKVVMILGSGMHRCIIPTIKQNSANFFFFEEAVLNV